MRLKRTIVFIAFVTLVFLFLGRHLNAQNTESPAASNILYLSAGMEDALNKLRSAEARIVHRQSDPKEWVDFLKRAFSKEGTQISDLAEEKKITAWWHLQGPKLAMHVLNDPDLGGSWVYTRQVFDEKTERGLQASQDQSGPYYSGSVGPLGNGRTDGMSTDYRYLDPRYYCYFYGKHPFHKLLKDPAFAATIRSEEMLYGSRCAKVEITLSKTQKAFFWVDLEHDFLIRRSEFHEVDKNPAVVIREMSMPKLQESNGVWLPSTVVIKDYISIKEEEGNDKGARATYTLVKEVLIDNFKADFKMPPEVFDLNWPLGTNLEDIINQRKLLVIAMEKDDLAVLNQRRKAQGKPEYTSTPIEEKELTALNQRRKAQGKPELKDPVAVGVEQGDVAALEKLQAQPEKKP